MNLPTPKYQIGDTVYTSSYTVTDVFCKTCNQSIAPDDDDSWMDRRVIIVTEHVVQGCSVRQGMGSVYDDGVSYMLSKHSWQVDEEAIYSTNDEARQAVEREFQELLDRRRS